MDIQTLQAVMNEMNLVRTRFQMSDIDEESDFSMGKLVAMDHVLTILRDSIEYEAELRDMEAV